MTDAIRKFRYFDKMIIEGLSPGSQIVGAPSNDQMLQVVASACDGVAVCHCLHSQEQFLEFTLER
ncbi:hypothetical protein OB08_11790 [Microbacterium sp. HJ5]